MNTKKQNQDKRAEEFLSCLGHGKSIYELECDNDLIDEQLQALAPQIKSRSVLE